ncbi:hypothetical protein ABIA16_003827 [Sinorhizobium fredii]
MNFRGTPIVTSLAMTVPAEDWSRVRSPSRARRRMRQGHRQNVRHYQAPDPRFYMIGGAIHCHPVMLEKLRNVADMDAPRFGMAA